MDRSTKRSFNFVNLQHPDDLKDEETQLLVRRYAMTEFAKSRRKPRTKRERNEIVLHFRQPLTEKCPSVERFGSSTNDPFDSYPIELDEDARTLISYLNPSTFHSNQLRGCWYPVSLSSPAAFYNCLANSQNFVYHQIHGVFPSYANTPAMKYHNKALGSAITMMKDPSNHTGDEMIGAIASFMAYLDLLGDFSGGDWEKHRNALVRVVGLRGGYDTINKEYLRITLTWVDLVGCFAQDVPPIVPMPHCWEAESKSPPNSPRPLSPVSLVWKRRMPIQLDYISIFDDIVQLISLDQGFNDEQKMLAMTRGSWMEPTIYRLLAIRPLLLSNETEHLVEEVCRLGTLLFLAPLWKALGMSPVWTAAIVRNLMRVLTYNRVEWNELKPILVWVLYFALIETKVPVERSQYSSMLAALVISMQLYEWDEIMQVVKGVLWVEKVFAGSDELVREGVMQIITKERMSAVLMAANSWESSWT